jgi:hypothetical protein
MTVYAQTWCPGDPCDPCCYAQPASDYEINHVQTEIDIDFGAIKLCPRPFVWPFVNRTVVESATGNIKGYFPLNIRSRGSIIVGGAFTDSIDRFDLTYLGSSILSCTVTHKHIGGNPNSSPVIPWTSEERFSSPAPSDPIQIKYDLALSLANQVGLTIRQYFGDYTQDYPSGPIKLTGFVYSGFVDETQDKVLKNIATNVAGPAGTVGFSLLPVIYYEQITVPLGRQRRRVRLVGRYV